MNIVVVGIQWGDEGKGKIVDFLAKDKDKCEVVVRFQGGNNAGHTLVVEGSTYKLHLIPSGILYNGKICILGQGMVIDPEVLTDEMSSLESSGHSLKNLYISERAHVIMPYHKLWEALEEKFKGAKKIGTTMRGIGPCYSDKASRLGIRIIDLLNPKILEDRLSQIIPLKRKIFQGFGEPFDISLKDILSQYLKLGERLRSHVTDTALLINQYITSEKPVLFEGAQGFFLGIDNGTYPFVTSSNTTAANACCGSGIGPVKKINKVIAVSKAYCTRVGAGRFPSEILDEKGSQLREQGKEYGTTTGRPRRCGWLDLAMLKYACIVNGVNEIALTKLDVLSKINPLKICTGYLYRGKRLDFIPADLDIIQEIEPVYEELGGWQEDISNCRSFKELPLACRDYVQKIEEFLKLPVAMISVGPERSQTIMNI